MGKIQQIEQKKIDEWLFVVQIFQNLPLKKKKKKKLYQLYAN